MKPSKFGTCLIVALAASGFAGAQGDKKLPALAHDATLVKLEDKKGLPTKLYYATSEQDAKRLGYEKGDHPITRATKFIFVGPDGEKTFTQKTVMADREAMKYLQADSKIRVQVTGIEVEMVHFGPELKPAGIKRVR